jgi:hypothetical protein
MKMKASVFLGMALFAGYAQELKASEFQSPRVAAMGGAGRAGPLSTDAIYLNPSYIPHIPLHVLSLNYINYRGAGGDYYAPTGHVLNAAFQDGTKNSFFQAGLGYTRFTQGAMFHLGVAAEVNPNWSIGISAKLIQPNFQYLSQIVNGSLSMTWVIAKMFRAAVIADNLLKTGLDQGLLREVTLATKFSFGSDVSLYVDPHWYPDLGRYPDSFGLEAGLEVFLSEIICFRAGAFRNSKPNFQSQRREGAALGLGFVFPRTAIDYSISRGLGKAQLGYAHNVAISVYF